MNFRAPYDKETTLQCPSCSEKMHICRSCHNVKMACHKCGKEYPLRDFISQADKAMEEFLENVYCDRI